MPAEGQLCSQVRYDDRYLGAIGMICRDKGVLQGAAPIREPASAVCLRQLQVAFESPFTPLPGSPCARQ